MDLTKIEGLTEEQQAAIIAQYDADISGLKSKNDELLSEKKSVQQSAQEKEKALEEARKAAQDAKAKELEAQGKYEEAQKLREEERAKLVAEAEQKAELAQSNLDKYHKTSALNSVMNLIHDDFKEVSSALLSNMLNISYNDQGEAITEFKHNGEVVAKNVDEFKGWAVGQGAFKRILKGVDSSGADSTNNSRNTSGVNGDDKDSAFKNRLKQAGLT